jgi:valyl-tRNA synthetase
VVAGEFEFQIPLAGLVDSSAEASRLESEVKKLREDIGFVEKRLANPNFVDKAKPELVDKERARLTEFQEKIKSLETSLAKLKD